MPPLLADAAGSPETLGGVGLVMVVLTVGATAAAVIACGHLGAQGRVHPNMAFGIRTAYTLSDDDAWYTVHALAAPWTVASGVVMAVPLVVVPCLGDALLQAVVLLAPMGVSVVLLCLGVWRAQRTARARAARAARA